MKQSPWLLNENVDSEIAKRMSDRDSTIRTLGTATISRCGHATFGLFCRFAMPNRDAEVRFGSVRFLNFAERRTGLYVRSGKFAERRTGPSVHIREGSGSGSAGVQTWNWTFFFSKYWFTKASTSAV